MSNGDIIEEIESKYYLAETNRQTGLEDRWSRAYHNYRGLYYKDIHFQEHEKSRVFIKATKTKVLAAFGQVNDLVFQSGHLPISVSKTSVPNTEVTQSLEIPEEPPTLTVPQQTNPFNVGYKGDENKLPPGAKFGDVQPSPMGAQGAMGGPTMGMPQQEPIDPVKAARNAEKLIQDQIEDVRGHVCVRDALFEFCLLGTGILKGPFNTNKLVNKWDKEGNLSQNTIKVPKIEFVSCWDFYPDPEATNMEEAEWTIQKHKLSRTQFLNLLEQPNFNAEAIQDVLRFSEGNANKTDTKESEVQAEEGGIIGDSSRWEVLEYWGPINGMKLPDGFDFAGQDTDIHINAWIVGGQVIRLILNPFEPNRLPYLAFPYEKNPYSFWGVGVAENMDDMQSMMNGTARMAIDNAALAGNLVFDVDESALQPGEDMTIYPGKVFRRTTGLPGQSIYGIKFPNTAHDNMMMFDRWRQLADESTGLPSYSHGNTGVTGMTRTAAGMSMLMGAANLNIKTAIKNLDDFCFEPLGKYYFYWNKQFYDGDLMIDGDLEVKATGTQSLIQKEVKSQRLLTFLQLAANPAVAPMINLKNVVEDLAHTLDADSERYINDLDAARQQAEIIGLQNQQMQQGEAPQEGTTGNGGGNIGVGQAAQPGEAEFSGE